jgi:hypothetical protein
MACWAFFNRLLNTRIKCSRSASTSWKGLFAEALRVQCRPGMAWKTLTAASATSARSSGRGVALGQLREVAEGACDAAEGVDLLHQPAAEAFEAFGGIGCIRLPRALEVLDAELHRGERVLDLVGHLPRHFAPRAFAFAAGESVQRTGAQLFHLAVVHLHQLTHLVVALVAEGTLAVLQVNGSRDSSAGRAGVWSNC